jgi:putative membrane protein
MRAEMALGITAALFGVLLLTRPSGLYPWLKAVHVIAIIAWMAGSLLPRLFVYHCEAERGSSSRRRSR